MKQGFLIQPFIDASKTVERVSWQINPYDFSAGVIRAFQKFAAIALTTKGTDSMRPWVGTKFSTMPRMNISDRQEAALFARDQAQDAIKQFFMLQSQETGLKDDDIINTIDIVNIDIDAYNNVTVEFMFYPRTQNAVRISLKV